jgi:RimJ/RimL family protein N-acetyltransferase
VRHDVAVEGYAYRLRPVAAGDARFIMDLRTDPKRNAFIHPTPNNIDLQKRWIEEYFERAGDYYFVIESRAAAQPQGTIGLYTIDIARRCGEWGRWVVQEDSMAALESAVLIYRVAFDMLDLSMVYARTAITNERVVRFHDVCGLERHAVLPGFLQLRAGAVDAVEHRITRERWENIKAALGAKAARLARVLAR